MTTELYSSHSAQELFTSSMVTALHRAYIQDPSIWLGRDPEAEEKMLRDPDIAHAVGMRRDQIAGRQWTLLPRDKSAPSAKLSVEVGTRLVEGIHGFTMARGNLARAFFSGSRFARICGETRKLKIGDGKERWWWVPTRLDDIDKRMMRVANEKDHETGKTKRLWEYYDLESRQWVRETMDGYVRTIRHVYQDDQNNLGHGRALREVLGWLWYAKTHLAQEALTAAERFGSGMLKMGMDGLRDAASGNINEELMRRMVAVLENMRSRHVLVHDKDDSIEHLSMSGTGDLILNLLKYWQGLTNTVILSANLTVSATEGGSYALAEAQENSTESRVQNEREMLEETLTRDIMRCVWYFNKPNMIEMGIAEEMPRFNLRQEKRLDPVQRATVAIQLLSQGIPLAKSEVYEQTGFREPEDGEEVIEGRQQMPGGFQDPFAAPMPGIPGAPMVSPAGETGRGQQQPQGGVTEVQDTALNGAQVQAAADIIDRVVRRAMPAGTALRMLVSMFHLPEHEARAMIEEAEAFVPQAPAEEVAA